MTTLALHPESSTAAGRTLPLLPDVLRRLAAERGDQVAYRFLRDGEEEVARWTWQEVEQRARAVAAALDRAGAGGERALLLFPPGLDFVAALLGCFTAGVVAVPSYPPRRRDQRLRSIAADARPAFVLTTRGALAGFQRKVEDLPELAESSGRGAVRWLTTDDLDPADSQGWKPPLLDGMETALLQYTSGSTGDPRGVVVQGSQLAHNEALIQQAFELDERSVIVSWLPTYHDMGLIGGVLQPLWAGASCVLMSPGAFLRRPARWLEAIHRYRGTTSGGPNFAYELCVRRVPEEERAALDLSSWRVAFNGAEPIHSGTLERFAHAFAGSGFDPRASFPCYGLAEATLFVSGGPRTEAPRFRTVERSALAAGKVMSAEAGQAGAQTLVASGQIGRQAGHGVRIVDPDTRRLAAPNAEGEGSVGEIWVTGPSLATGYWRRPEATDETFHARLEEEPDRRFLRTGDLGFIAGDQLFVTGRIKDLVILRGRNHYPNDLERTAELSHPQLPPGSCAAFAVEGEGEEQLVLVFEGPPRLPEDEALVVAAAVRQAIAREHEVQATEVMAVRAGTLPRTSSGKVQRHRCRQLYLAGELQPIGSSRLTPLASAPPATTAPGALRAQLLELPGNARTPVLLATLGQLAARSARMETDALPSDAPLSSLGLDSLAAVELAHTLELALRLEISPADLLEAPSLEALAEMLAARLDEERAPGEITSAPLRPGTERAAPTATDLRPLGRTQRDLWLADRLAPQRSLYNLSGAARLRGLDEDALGRALEALLVRHEALRTAFPSPDGEPRRRVLETVTPRFEVIDAKSWSETTLRQAFEQQARQPFDPDRPPLLRLTVARLARGEHAILASAHHLVTDFWSWGLLLRDLEHFYRRETGRSTEELPELVVGLDQALAWRQERLEEHREKWLAAWDRQLAGAPEVLDLPSDRPRPAAQSFRGRTLRRPLPSGLAEDLEGLARSHGTTLFAVLLAGFQTLLHRHSGQDDLLVGTPTAGRTAAALRELVGYFVNPVPLRSALAGDPEVGALLAGTREALNAALRLQELPFGELVEHRLPQRDASRGALFQHLFVFHRPHLPQSRGLVALTLGAARSNHAGNGESAEDAAPARFADLPLAPIPLDPRNALYDLTLALGDTGGGRLVAALELAEDLFDTTTGLRLLQHYEVLLQSMVEDPRRRLSQLALWTAAERWQVIGEWSHDGRKPAQEPAAATLYELFAERARHQPAAAALELADGRSCTYGDLASGARRWARELRRHGVGPEVTVGICLERGEELVVALLAVLEAGGAYVPLDPAYPRSRIDFMLADSGARVVISRDPSLGSGSLPRLDPSDLGEAADGGSVGWTARPENLAYIIYTSGSTGVPKGVAISHGSAVAMVRWALGVWSRSELSAVAAVTSVCFDLSVYELFVPLAAGGCVILAQDALALPGHPAAGRVRLLNTVPSAAAELLRGKRLPPGIITVNLAGEPLAQELAEEILRQPGIERLFDLYGPSEDTTYSTVQRVLPGQVPSIGRTITGTRVQLLDRHLRPVPLGVPGELCLSGDGLARGYAGRGARTAAAFIPDPLAGRGLRPPGSRLYRTGDLARFDAQGRLRFLGRRDHQIKLRGFRIELGEVEAALRSLPEVTEAAAQVWAGGSGGDQLVAYVVRGTGGAGQETPASWRQALTQRLPPAMVPSRITVLEKLPRTLTGKLDRKTLPAPESVAGSEGSSPATESEKLVARLFEQLLGLDGVSREDDFFALGGHSLAAARLTAELRHDAEVELPLQQIFQTPTVAALAVEIDHLRQLGEAAGARFELQSRPRALPRPLAEPAPASFAQERIWFLEHLLPGSAAYHLPFGLELRGELDASALEQALAGLARRHEALRTAFEEADGGPVQRVLPPGEAPVRLPVEDLRGLPAEEVEAARQRITHRISREGFDLSQGPLWRALLLRLGDREHQLLLNLHHTIADGGSLEVFSRELSAGYEAARGGSASEAGKTAELQPADLAVWERQRWSDGELAEALEATRRRIGDRPEPLALPTDRPRTAGGVRRGDELAVMLPPDLAGELEKLGRRHDATLFMVLMGLYQVLLGRWSEQRRLLVGFPIARRDRRETQDLIGLLANTLVAAGELTPGSSFLDHLAAVRRDALSAYAHQDLPFEQLVEALTPGRQLGQNPLFQVSFALQDTLSTPQLPGLRVRARALATGSAKLDLALFLHPRPDGALEGTLEYDRELFDRTTVQRLWHALRHLARGAVATPELALGRLPLLGPAELHQLTVEWNDTARPMEPAWVMDRLLHWAQSQPEAPALEACREDPAEGSEHWTYSELVDRALRLGGALRALGVGAEAVVPVAYPRSPVQVQLILAVVAAGGAYLPVDPAYPPARQEALLRDSGARWLLAPAGSPLRAIEGPWSCRSAEELIASCDENQPAPAPQRPVSGEQAVYVIYTSGSTGRPKGVVVSHGGLRNLVDWHTRRFSIGPGDRTTLLSGVGFDASVYELWPSLTAGACLCLPPAEIVTDPLQLARWLRSQRITSAFLPTPLAEPLLEQDALEGSDLRQLQVAGDRLRKRPAPGCPWTLINAYGPAENTVAASVHRVAPADAAAGAFPSIGRPIDNQGMSVVSSTGGFSPGALQPVGAVGELVLTGAGLARGYLGQPVETARRFVPDPESTLPGARRYRTGDRVRQRPDGRFDFLGRVDDQVKIRGQRLEPREVEAVLAEQPEVAEAVVITRPGPTDDGELRLLAYVVARGPGVDGGELRARMARRLPTFMVPAAVTVLDALPLTHHGKIDRRALPEPQAPRTSKGHHSPPDLSPIEELLAGLWHELLGVTPGSGDDFFDLGGHSLLATRLASAVRQRLGVELPVRAVFEHGTLGELAARVETLRREGSLGQRPPLEPVPREGEIPVSFAQQRLWFLDQLEPESPLYNVPLALRLDGGLSPAALSAAMDAVVERHETLRSELRSDHGAVHQRILPPRHLPLPAVDLSHLPGPTAEDVARELARREARRALDLARGRLLRQTLLRLGEKRYWLLLTLHHIAADGWSVGILMRELSALYAAFLEPSPGNPLSPLPVQYADFAAWQRSWLQGERLEAEIDHWRRQLASPPILDLPTDRPRPALQSFVGEQLPVHLPRELVESLEALARRTGGTLFMVLLASFAALLSRLSGQRDLVLGSPVANRTLRETEDLIGFFVNMLALRLDLSDQPGEGGLSFPRLVERVRRVALEAYAHQDLPFERVVEELGVARDLSRNPLFQVVFTLQNAPLELPRLPGVEASAVPVDSGTARFDLTLTLLPRGAEGLLGSLEYNRDLYDATTAERWVGHWQTLLEDLVEHPDQPTDELPITELRCLSTAQRHQLRTELNDTSIPLPPETLPELFAAQSRRTPEALALIDGETRWTYRQLERRVRTLAARLRHHGAGPGQVVGLLCERSAAMVAALLGILESGAAYLPLDPEYPQERLRFVLDDARPVTVLTGRRQVPLVRERDPLILEDALAQALASAGEARPGVGTATPEDLAYVIYTSGSTGRPKGVAVDHGNACHFLRAMDEVLGAEPTTLLAVTSISFDISVLELLWTLTRGSQVVLQGDRAVELYGAARRPAEVTPRPIDFSLFYFADESEADRSGGRYRLLLEGARFADRNGFSALWTPERHFHSFGGLYPNPSVTGAAVAAVTERLAIRAGSVVLPLHNPLRVAEEWSVVDNLSGGRAGISVASGWHANDFVLAPGGDDGRRAAFEDRKQNMLDAIGTLRRLWRGESVRQTNALGAEVELAIHPPPVQPELPLWLTAAGNPETFGLAGTLGMGLLTHLLTQSREELAEKIRLYRNAWRSAGNDGEGHVTLMIHTFVDRDAERALDVVREPFTAYLRSSLNLVRPIASSMGVDLDADDFDDATQRMVLDHAFQRFAESSALFGSAESCLAQVEALKDLGVDEIGCLIDFGCPTDEVLGSFDELRDLLRWSNPRRFPDAAADRSVAAQIRRHGVETLQCTPSMARLLAAEPKGLAALGSLDRLLLGGETVPEDLVADLAEAGCGRILDVYGPTETTVWSTVDDDLSPQRPVTVGRPLANTQTYVVDRHGRLQPPGVPGELWIGGAGVTRGYLGRPSLTAQRFTPDPYGDQPGARVYRTGDRVRLDRVGRLLFLGRLDHQVKVAGHRIELGEVESLLLRLPGVAETVAVVHQEAGGAPSLAAYVVPEPWAREDASADTFPLPDGRRIAHLGAFQTSVAVRELFEEDWYWKFGLELPDEPWVFDVGANIGLFSLQVVDRRPEAHVVAFEPLPPTFEALSRNLRRWVPNGHAVHAGVADRPGEASFTFYPQMSGLSGRYADQEMDRGSARAIIEGGLEERSAAPSVADEELERFLDTEFESETHTCRLTTLSETIDRLGVERIDLLKIDVERAELDVLRGLRDEHWPLVQQVVAEVDTRENLERIVPMLEARGFEVRVENFFEARAADGSEVLVKMLYARRPDLPAMPPPADLASLRRPVTADALRGYLTRHLAPPMVPNHFVLLEEMPRTPNGKIDRRALPSPREAAAHRERHYVAPQLDSERALAEVWQEVLGVERVGLDENFFELGGTSLLLVQLRSRIQQRLGHEVALVDLFRYPTVGSLDEHLRSQPKSEAASGFERVDDRMEKKRQALNRRRRPPKRGR